MIELTEPQEALMTADGDFLLIACPGSGKTRTGAARVGALAEAGKKVAVCSYTNVGADRIGTVIDEMGVQLGPEHFIGPTASAPHESTIVGTVTLSKATLPNGQNPKPPTG